MNKGRADARILFLSWSLVRSYFTRYRRLQSCYRRK